MRLEELSSVHPGCGSRYLTGRFRGLHAKRELLSILLSDKVAIPLLRPNASEQEMVESPHTHEPGLGSVSAFPCRISHGSPLLQEYHYDSIVASDTRRVDRRSDPDSRFCRLICLLLMPPFEGDSEFFFSRLPPRLRTLETADMRRMRSSSASSGSARLMASSCSMRSPGGSERSPPQPPLCWKSDLLHPIFQPQSSVALSSS